MFTIRQAGRLAALAIGTVAFGAALAGSPAMAAQPAEAGKSVVHAAPAAHAKAYFCAKYNNVRYWRFPGRDPMGQIHRGQGMNFNRGETRGGERWWNVNLWGGPSGVWVLTKNVTVCRN
jgi:hypothetical protein